MDAYCRTCDSPESPSEMAPLFTTCKSMKRYFLGGSKARKLNPQNIPVIQLRVLPRKLSPKKNTSYILVRYRVKITYARSQEKNVVDENDRVPSRGISDMHNR